jgi:hypothetical protein
MIIFGAAVDQCVPRSGNGGFVAGQDMAFSFVFEL